MSDKKVEFGKQDVAALISEHLETTTRRLNAHSTIAARGHSAVADELRDLLALRRAGEPMSPIELVANIMVACSTDVTAAIEGLTDMLGMCSLLLAGDDIDVSAIARAATDGGSDDTIN